MIRINKIFQKTLNLYLYKWILKFILINYKLYLLLHSIEKFGYLRRNELKTTRIALYSLHSLQFIILCIIFKVYILWTKLNSFISSLSKEYKFLKVSVMKPWSDKKKKNKYKVIYKSWVPLFITHLNIVVPLTEYLDWYNKN